MGNRLCKKKTDAADGGVAASKIKPGTRKFDRIIGRLHLRPTSWKSDSHLNEKRINRYAVSPPDSKRNHARPVSKSSDWTDAHLEVPRHDDDDDVIRLKNPKLALIFDDEKSGTPTPPPRKNQIRRNLKEKIESVAKNGLQALQAKKPVEEELFVKKKINYGCPVCDQDEKNHNRDHHHNHNHEDKKQLLQNDDKKEGKRKKNLSIISLPNYNELKLSVANPDKSSSKPNLNSSRLSLQSSKKMTTSSSTGRLDSYFNRCRSFGSLIPQQLKKLKTQKAPDDVESDDSFVGLEDWDLGLIEHYNPKEASLPRPRKMALKKDSDVLADIESLVVNDAEIVPKPKPKQRKSESLVKKINRNAQEARSYIATPEDVCLTPPPSPEAAKMAEPSPKAVTLPTEVDGKVEHSSLMRILQEFSPKCERRQAEEKSVRDFINAEKMHTGLGLDGKTPAGVYS